MHVVGHCFEPDDVGSMFVADLADDLLEAFVCVSADDGPPVRRAPHAVSLQR